MRDVRARRKIAYRYHTLTGFIVNSGVGSLFSRRLRGHKSFSERGGGRLSPLDPWGPASLLGIKLFRCLVQNYLILYLCLEKYVSVWSLATVVLDKDIKYNNTVFNYEVDISIRLVFLLFISTVRGGNLDICSIPTIPFASLLFFTTIMADWPLLGHIAYDMIHYFNPSILLIRYCFFFSLTMIK